MRPWARRETATTGLEGRVTGARRQVEDRAREARAVAAEVEAAAELVRVNRAALRQGWVERRHHGNPRYAGPERRGT